MIPDSVPPVVVAALAFVVLTVLVAAVGTLSRLVLRLLAAPGVVVHEFAHEQVCNLVGVSVTEVVYFRFGEPPGYVRHEQPRRYRESFAISVAPFLVNTVVALAAFLGFAAVASSMGVVDAFGAGGAGSVVSELWDALASASIASLVLAAVLAWLGFAVGTQAFPSTGDANTLWSRSRAEWRQSPVVLLGVPVVVVIYLVNILSWLWADVLYALALALVAFSAIGIVGF